MPSRPAPTSRPNDEDALGLRLAALESHVYQRLTGTAETCEEIAVQADAAGLTAVGIRARLLASDVRSRQGHAAEARAGQIELHAAAAPWPELARRAAIYLLSSCERLGRRVEGTQWARAALAEGTTGVPAWHAEALMVTALFSISRSGADYTLAAQALAAVRASCSPVLVSVTAANFAEVASECGEMALAHQFADDAVATLHRHPEAAAALTWESVARARLACGELTAAEHAIRESLSLEAQIGCSDVNGDPWLTCAEVLLAQGDAPGALAMLEHPRRPGRGRASSWTNTRTHRVLARTLAALGRWEEAYHRMVEHAAAYEQARSIEGDRAVVESSATVAMEEERRRSREFEHLAFTDPLTGLPNRRHAERWLAEHAAGGDPAATAGGLCVAIADLDHFKHINDTCSHDTGDLVLKRVGTLLVEVFNAPAAGHTTPMLAARLGGEEFLLAWSGISLDAAMHHGNALCGRLRRTPFTDIVGGLPVTLSLGLAWGARPVDISTLLQAADKCLYEAKRAGRDRVVGSLVRQGNASAA